MPSTPSAHEGRPRSGSSLSTCAASATASSCQPAPEATSSPGAKPSARDWTTSDTAPPVITPPISTGAA